MHLRVFTTANLPYNLVVILVAPLYLERVWRIWVWVPVYSPPQVILTIFKPRGPPFSINIGVYPRDGWRRWSRHCSRVSEPLVSSVLPLRLLQRTPSAWYLLRNIKGRLFLDCRCCFKCPRHCHDLSSLSNQRRLCCWCLTGNCSQSFSHWFIPLLWTASLLLLGDSCVLRLGFICYGFSSAIRRAAFISLPKSWEDAWIMWTH